MIRQIQRLIDQGLNAYHIAQILKLRGRRVHCFGSYYTVGSKPSSYVCFFETEHGVRCRYVNP